MGNVGIMRRTDGRGLNPAKALVICVVVAAFALLALAPGALAKGYAPARDDAISAYGENCLSNGKYEYYVDNHVLYRKTVSSGALKVVKKLPKGSNSNKSWYVGAVYKGCVYLNMKQMSPMKMAVYSVSTKGGKLTKAKGSCEIKCTNGGKYVACNKRFHTDASDDTYAIYKLSGAKLKQVKSLAKHGFGITLVGNKVYYESAKDSKLSKNVRLYRCNINGAGKKLIGGPWNALELDSSTIYASGFTSKHCNILAKSTYQYTYSTKKLKEL